MALKTQYELLGLDFEYHRHGSGPMHYSAKASGLVFEIYPLTKSQTQAGENLRLGFEVKNREQTISTLFASNWKIVTATKDTEWGKTVVVQDMDGRKVELTEKTSSSNE